MSYLKEKSNLNLQVAEDLVKQSIYAPSVHCSYFGCLQFLKHTLNIYRGISFSKIEEECKNYIGGTHGFIIDSCLADYKKLVDFKSHKDLKRELKDLKTFRVTSDYFDIQIGDNEGEMSLKYSQNIIREIGKVLKK